MKKLLLVVALITMWSPLCAAKDSAMVVDVLGHYTRQITSPTLNMAGAELIGSFLIKKSVGLDLFFSMDLYKVTVAAAAEVSYQNYNYGAGARFYLIPEMYIKAKFGKAYSRASAAGITATAADWRYGGGIAYVIPMTNNMGINIGADFYRYNTQKVSLFVASAGLTFAF
jgi:hypothetical protein